MNTPTPPRERKMPAIDWAARFDRADPSMAYRCYYEEMEVGRWQLAVCMVALRVSISISGH